MLYRLSYVGAVPISPVRVERETGFEPATNSLEGCDSTPELLPRFFVSRVPVMVGREGFEPP